MTELNRLNTLRERMISILNRSSTPDAQLAVSQCVEEVESAIAEAERQHANET